MEQPCEVEPGSDGGWVLVLRSAGGDAGDRWCERLREVLDGPGTVVRCDARDLEGSAVDVLDALARLQLAARRGGGEIHLRGAAESLVRLLELAGLAGVVRVEREPEAGEETGI